MIEPNELASLIMGAVGVAITFNVVNKQRLPRFRFFLLGLCLLLSANFFTVIEGIILGAFFNILEHLAYLCGGLSFAAAAWDVRRRRLSSGNWDEHSRSA